MFNLLFRHILFALLIFLSALSSADNSFEVDEHFAFQSQLLPWLSFWQGDAQNLSNIVEQRAYFTYWSTIEESNNIPSWKDTYFTLSLKNTSKEKLQLLLVLAEPLIDTFTVLQVDAKGNILREDTAGNQHSFEQRVLKHRHLVFPVDIEAGQKIQLFILANGRLDRLNTNLALWQRNAFFERTDKHLVMQSVYATLLILFAVYAGFLVFIVREHSYLWFSVFTFSLFIRVMTQNNFFFEFIWPNWPSLQNIAFISALLATSVSLALFAKAYLAINHKRPKLGKFYTIYAWLHLPLTALFIAMHWQPMYLIFWIVPAWIFAILILYSAFSAYRHGQKDALAFFIAYSLMIIISLLSIADHVFALDLPWIINGELGELALITTIAITLSLRIGKSQAQAHMRLAQSRAKNEFLAKMSHEIRTPINGVLGMVQLLQETTLTRKQQHYADVISHCGRTLLNVINDILEYSKIQAGKLEIEQRSFRLDELLQKHNEIFWPQIQDKGLQFNFNFPPEGPLHFLGDPSRIQQVLNNIFSNAVKFTERGQIDFTIQVKVQEDNNACLHFMIKDTGIGMSPSEQERVFAPFVQANSSTNRQFGGSGLGLNITRQLVKLLQGELHLESQAGLGSCFIVELPLTIDTQAETHWCKELKQLEGKRIILLSSQSSQQDEMYQILSHWGIKPFHFQDNSEASNFIEHTEHSVDLVMMSKAQALDMPVLDKNYWNKQESKMLIYSSSFANSSTRIFGFNHATFLKHPYSLQLLYDKLLFLFGGGQDHIQNKLQTPYNIRLQRPNLRLLVAEDDATNRLVIRAILKKLQLEHEIVADGQLALDAYSKNSNGFDAIIMDYEMPVLDGCQATEAIRQLEKQQGLKPVPIIALTAHVLEEFKQRCLASGMNSVLAKPIIINELIETLNQYCSEQ